MNHLLYITFHVFNPVAGVSKKIFDQVKAFKNNGIESDILFLKEKGNKRMVIINDKEIAELSHGIKGQIQIISIYKKIINYINNNNIDTVFIRYNQTAEPFFINFIKNVKKLGCKILLEIPTYPYDGEFSGKGLLNKFQNFADKIFRQNLKNYIDYIITTSNFDRIFGIETIRISNAVNKTEIPLSQKLKKENELVLISVASISFWHGLDRIILGIKDYYLHNPTKIVKLIIIGNGDPIVINHLQKLIKKQNLQSQITYVGPQFGKELDKYYDQADLAVGCLACHRKNITEVKSLKNVEYAMRGLPMFYSEENSDFDNMPYVYKVVADDSPINISSLISFYDNLNINSSEIRQSVSNLTWDKQIKKIIEKI